MAETAGGDEVRVLDAAATEHDKHIAAHACKEWPSPCDPERVVEAFGARKCPRLIEQLQMPNVNVRITALRAVGNVLKNPYDVVSCIRAGIVRVLVDMMKDPEAKVREGSTKAFAIASTDPNFRQAVLKEQVVKELKELLYDKEPSVRSRVYEALVGLSAGPREGCASLVDAEYVGTLVAQVEVEEAEVQEKILRILHNCVADNNKGLRDALANQAVETCLRLTDSPDATVRKEACSTLSLLCFADAAKEVAIRNQGLPILCNASDPEWPVRAAVASALMVITTMDEGKKQIFPAGGVHKLMRMLDEDQDVVLLNVLKVLANAAVLPDARKLLKEDQKFLVRLEALVTSGPTELIKKHAAITRSVVLWKP